ncbi:oligosaccharide flippase family protein [Photobacterium damselae]|uniref:oligosaccharide flippase family protein n=1 Tax=Photobacterium damselae TaxID=38293 RepID=UPI00165DC548|nr:oligosaccharide flippase family protein [Photobacterium damselae]
MKSSLSFNIVILFFERVLQLGGGLFVSGVIARYLSVSDFGQWQLALQLLAYVGTIGLVCGAEIILPKLSKNNDSKIIINAFILRMTFSFISIIIGISFLFCIDIGHHAKVFSIILLFSLLFNEPFAIFSCYLQSKTDNFPLVVVRFFSISSRILIVLAVCFLKLNIYILSFAWLIESVITGLGYYYCFNKFKSNDVEFKRDYIELGFINKLIKQGVLFLSAQFLLMTSLRLDRIIIAKYANPVFTGNYMAVTQLVDSLFQFSIIINTVFLTYFIYSNGFSKKKDLISLMKLFFIYLLISSVGSFSLYNLSGYIIPLIYGDKYNLAINLLKDISFIIPFFTISLLLSSILFKYSRYSYYLIVNAVSTMFVFLYVVYKVKANLLADLIYTPYLYTTVAIFLYFVSIARIFNEKK